jgi:hypothetical protein
MFHWRLTSLACLVCLAAVVSTSARAAQPVLTVGEYRHQANAICSDFNRFQLPAGGALADGLTAVVAKGRSSLTALRRLRPPRSLAKLHGEIVATNTQRVDLLASLVTQLKAEKITISQLADRLARSPLVADANALWKRAGAADCVQY